jgi:transcriptional regulator with XRE-family HTH domain
MEFAEKLTFLIEKLGLNQNSFASELGITSTSVYNMLGPRKSKPSHEFYEKLAERYPHIDLNYFFKEDHSNYDLNELTIVNEPVAAYGASPGKIPVLSIKTAANSLMGIQSNEPVEAVGFLEMPKEIVGSGTLVALPVRGNSMAPVIYDGSYVILKLLDRSEWDDLINGKIYMIYSEMYGSQIKYVRRSERQPNLLILESENVDHDLITISTDEVTQIWELKASIGLKWSSLKKTYFDRLNRIELNITDLQMQLHSIKNQPKQIK